MKFHRHCHANFVLKLLSCKNVQLYVTTLAFPWKTQIYEITGPTYEKARKADVYFLNAINGE